MDFENRQAFTKLQKYFGIWYFKT